MGGHLLRETTSRGLCVCSTYYLFITAVPITCVKLLQSCSRVCLCVCVCLLFVFITAVPITKLFARGCLLLLQSCSGNCVFLRGFVT